MVILETDMTEVKNSTTLAPSLLESLNGLRFDPVPKLGFIKLRVWTRKRNRGEVTGVIGKTYR